MLTSAIVVFKLAPLLIIPILPIAILYLFFDKKFRQKLYKYIYSRTEKVRKAETYAEDLTDSKKLEEITINDAFDFIDRKYVTFWDKYTSGLTKIVAQRVTGLYTNQLMYDLITAFGYIFVFTKVLNKLMSIGNATLVIRSLQLMQDSTTDTVLVFNKTFQYSIKLKDAYSLFTTEAIVSDGSVIMKKVTKGPSVAIQNLNFTYPRSKKPIYSDFSLNIKAGEKIAIVGHNGAGKTTLIKLLARFYKVDSGKILINGTDVIDFSVNSYYQNVGIMFQDYNTYPQFTVSENVHIGRPQGEYNEEKVIDAMNKAEALGFVEKLPNKFQTTLSENFEKGVRLSTGQWQKLAIARFFYRNPAFVIFDEPTAAIDAVSEHKIFNQIYDFFKEKTVIIISHCFSTVRNADRIIVISEGKLIEEGSHSELIKMNGVYAKSFNLQAKGYS